MVYDQVPHKQGCTTTEDGLRGEISDLEDIELSMYIHKKTTEEVYVAPALDELTTVCNVGQAKLGHGACMKSMSRTNTTLSKIPNATGGIFDISQK